MVASPEKGWKTAADYVKAAKAAPGKLTYATAGTGSGTHMNAERFKLAAGIDTVHVPYKGTPEALGDTMNGRTDIYFCPVIAALPMIRDKRVVALANGSPKRSSVLPDLPTTEEQGFKDSGYNFWVGLFAPAGTPPALIARLNAEVKKALESPEVKERLAGARHRCLADDGRRARQDRRGGGQGQHRAGQEGRHQAAVGENG